MRPNATLTGTIIHDDHDDDDDDGSEADHDDDDNEKKNVIEAYVHSICN